MTSDVPSNIAQPGCRQATHFLVGQVQRRIGPLVPLRRDSPMMAALLFFLVDVAVIQGAVRATSPARITLTYIHIPLFLQLQSLMPVI